MTKNHLLTCFAVAGLNNFSLCNIIQQIKSSRLIKKKPYPFQQYIAPSLAYFGDIHHDPWNNFRLYGTVMVIALTFIVAVGVKFVAIFAPFSLACVIVSIICVFIGSFEASASTRDVM